MGATFFIGGRGAPRRTAPVVSRCIGITVLTDKSVLPCEMLFILYCILARTCNGGLKINFKFI